MPKEQYFDSKRRRVYRKVQVTVAGQTFELEKPVRPDWACKWCWDHYGTDEQPKIARHSTSDCPNRPHGRGDGYGM